MVTVIYAIMGKKEKKDNEILGKPKYNIHAIFNKFVKKKVINLINSEYSIVVVV